MKIEKMTNFNVLKFFILLIGFVLLFNFQTSKSEANTLTTLTMDEDIRMRIHGVGPFDTIETKGELKTKRLKFVNIFNSNNFFIKESNNNSIKLPNGSYNIFDITEQGDNTNHDNLTPGSWVTVNNGTLTPANILFNYYTVTFYEDISKNSILSQSNVLAGNNISEPTVPSKDMYSFTGWVDKNGTPFNFNNRIYHATEVYAKWEKKKYAILVVAGQSNAVGLDESPVDSKAIEEMMEPRINQLGFYGDDNLNVIPLDHSAQNFQDVRSITNPASLEHRGPKSIHLPLGKLLLQYIPDDYELVIIPAAFGAASFTEGKSNGEFDDINLKPIGNGIYGWGIDSAYYKSLKARLQYLLNHNEDNYYIGTVWCQGEMDARNPEGHFVGFETMTQDFFTYFNEHYPTRVKGGVWSKDQWFTYETVPYWSTIYAHADGIKQIWANYKNWSPSTYIPINFGDNSAEYTNETNGTKATSRTPSSHYGNDAYSKLVAPAVVKKMLEAGAIE